LYDHPFVVGSLVFDSVAHPSVPFSTSTHIPTTALVAQVTLPLEAYAGVAHRASALPAASRDTAAVDETRFRALANIALPFDTLRYDLYPE
jgi:hypothetical protein